MPAGDNNREEIILDVIAPVKDFVKEGGIANAIAALDVLDARLNSTNKLFETLGGGMPVKIDTAGMTQQIQSVVNKPLVIPAVLKIVESQSPGGTEIYSRATTTGNKFKQTTLFETADKGGNLVAQDQRVVQNFEAAARDEQAAKIRSAREQIRLSNERARAIAEAEKVYRQQEAARGDIFDSPLTASGEARLARDKAISENRERMDAEKAARDEQADRIRAWRAQNSERRSSYGLRMDEFVNYQTQQVAIGMGGISGTDPQRRAKVAELEKQAQAAIRDKAGELSSEASGAGDKKEAVAMQGVYSQAMKDHAKATLQASAANDQFNQSNRLIGKNMLENIKHVTTWAASVGVLYGTIRLVTRSLEENIAIGREMAILGQIFKGTASEVSDLTTKVMELAAANGQNATQAVEAATEFARIYHTQNDILAATNSALVLANVSGEEAGHTVEFLSAMTMVYKLHASELAGVIGQMAYASQNFNVTNKDLMKGLEATAESAKEAGISFSQLLGFISAGVGATGQSGTAMGNTVKTMIQEMANPKIQEKMRGQGIEVTQGGIGLKEMPQIFQEMFVAYERMSDAERRSMLFNVAGRQNATRMAAILDNYVQSQIIAIKAQLNLNSAQQENDKIMSTLSAQTAALVAEWDKFVKIQGNHGPMQALTEMATALKNLLTLVNAPGMNVLVALLGGAALAAGAKFAITGIGMNMESSAMAGVKGGLATSTVRALQGDLKALNVIMAETAQVGQERLFGALTSIGLGGSRAAAGLLEAGMAAKTAGIGFAMLADVILPLLAVGSIIWASNRITKAFGVQGPDVSEIDKYGGKAGAAKDTAALYATAYNVLTNPSTSSEDKARMAQQLKEGMGIDVTGPGGLADLQSRAQSQSKYAGIFETAQIEAAQREASRLSTQVRTQRGSHRANSIFGWNPFEGRHTWFDASASDLEGMEKDSAQAQQRVRELELARRERDMPYGPGYVQSQIAMGTPGARIGALSSGIGGIYSTMGTRTALDEHHRELARLQSDLDMKQRAFDYINSEAGMPKDASSLRGSINEAAWKAAQGALIEAGVAYNGQNSPQIEAQRRQQTEMTARFGWGAAAVGAQGVGFTEGEQMAQRDRGGSKLAYELEMVGRITEAHAVEIGLIENKQKALEKIYELEQQRANLAIKVNQEYARSLLTSSPSQLLEKLAVGQLSRHGMSAGSFFAMTTSAREDFMKRPGNTEEERVARRSENALLKMFPGGHGSDVWARNAVKNSFSQKQYSNMFGAGQGTPDLGISDVLQGVVSLGNVAAAAAIQISNMKDAAVSFIAGLRAAAGAPPTSNTPGFKSSNFVPQPTATIPGFRAYSQP